MKRYIRSDNNLDDIPIIPNFSYTNNRINNMVGISDEKSLADVLDDVYEEYGYDEFKVYLHKLHNVSIADIKDTFGGNYFQRHYGWKAYVPHNYDGYVVFKKV